MKSEWKTKSIGELTEYISKGISPKYTNEMTDNAIFVLNQKCNRDFKISYFEARLHDLSKKSVPEDKMICLGDVLINSTGTGTAGRVAQIKNLPCPTTVDGHMIILRPTSEIELFYYGYAIKSFQSKIETLAEGSTGQTEINRQRLCNEILISYPVDREIQYKISSLFCQIDEKIAVNNAINENLEQQAQAIFKSWFVDFEIFNEEMVVAPTGTLIPTSLKMVQIADIPHTLETGKRPKGGATSIGIPSVGAENVKKFGEFNFASPKYIPFEFAEKMKNGKIKGYELLLYKDGGKPGTFIPHFSMFGEGFPYSNFFINEHIFKLDFYNKGFNEFMYFYFQTDYPYHWLSNNGGKAAVPGINQQDVNAIWCYDPKHSKIQEFCKWVEPIFTTILTNCAQNMKLAQLRNTLLPKLMNGEIDVSGVKI